jgi:hypothetical protein
MGRPPIGIRAMTATERYRRWKERHQPKRNEQPAGSDPVLASALRESAGLRAAVERLTRERDEARASAAPAGGGRFYEDVKRTIAALQATVERQRKELADARAAAGAGPDAAALGAMVRENAALKATVMRLQAQLADAPGEVGKARREAKALRTRVANLQAQVRAMQHGSVTTVSKGDYRRIRAALHPDTHSDPARKADLERAFKAFQALKFTVLE